MIINELLTDLNKVVINKGISVQWTKDTETFIDIIENENLDFF